jgi:arylsulfatase A-like enzyme
VIVTSDHGEALFTRGYGDHGKGLFDDETALPLIAQLPGVEPARGRVGCPVGLVDLLPSLCAYLGIDCPDSVQGVSLLGGGATAARYLVSEAVAGNPEHRAIRNDTYKLIFEPRGSPVPTGELRVPGEVPYSLYNLVSDPEERHNLAASREVSADTYRVLEVMVPALHDAVAPFDTPSSRFEPLSDELRDRLRELGYGD